MQQDSLSNFPEVMVGFYASKISDSQVVLFNQELAMGKGERQILFDYSYLVCSTDGVVGNNSVGKKLFFAERYGGQFISRNGGGGRCGFDGVFQLKGIGRTPLVGTHNDATHSNGMLDLESALHEAIWGEVIHLILPHGAARTVAVLRLNEQFLLDGTIHTRALLVREAFVRPAHFERAPLFKEALSRDASLSNDALRVKKAIQRINSFLPTMLGSDSANLSGSNLDELFRMGIVELAKRCAQQFAVARCKNIMHMMMSSSNLSMNGGWLDLNSVTIVSQMSVREKRLFRQFEIEYLPLVRSLENICYYAKKYLPLSAELATETLSHAISEFEKCYQLTLRKNALMHVGFPKPIVESMLEGQEFKCFSDLLIKLMRHQSYKLGVEQIFGDLRFYSLPERPVVIKCAIHKGFLDVQIDWRVSNRYLRSELDEGFKLFLEAALKNSKISRTELLKIICINLTRYSRTPVILQNVNLYGLVKVLIRDAESSCSFKEKINSLMCESKDSAEICLATDKDFSVVMWKTGNDYIEYNGVVDKFCVVRNGKRIFVTWLQLIGLTDEILMAKYAVEFYKPVRGAFLEI